MFDAALSIGVVGAVRADPAAAFERDAGPVSFGSLLAGLRFVWRTELILATITLDLFAVLLGGATPCCRSSPRTSCRSGRSAWAGSARRPRSGRSMMALILAHRPPLRQAGPALLWAVAGFGAATIVFGLSRNPYLSFALLMLTGALDNVSVVVRSTLVQVLTPDSMRGRVSAVNAIFIGSSNELGEFESGMAAQLFGPVASVVGGGIGTILVVLVVGLAWPSVRRLGLAPGSGRARARSQDGRDEPDPRGQATTAATG